MDASTHTSNIERIYHPRNPTNAAASIQTLPNDAHLGSGVKAPMPIRQPLFCAAPGPTQHLGPPHGWFLGPLTRRCFLSVNRSGLRACPVANPVLFPVLAKT